jgi:Domain of Unknown Function with PDB structure (DUF3857)/Transglutaminase-like superfamily
MKLILNCLFIFFLFNISLAQTIDYSILSLPSNLKENANSVILNQQIAIQIVSQNKVIVKKSKTILVYNEFGLRNIDATEFYDKSTQINTFEASLYSSFGKKIKQFKDKDFSDRSAADGFSIYNDNRFKSLIFTPTEYPFIIVFNCETESSNTAFIPAWTPIDDLFESVLKSVISISFPEKLGFKYKEFNFDDKKIVKTETKNNISFSVENIPAYKPEEYAPSFQKLVPKVLFGLERFSLEGMEGTAKNWEDFGLWVNNNLLQGLDELPIETQNKIKTLVASETDPVKKAKIIYKYVQDKVRYVSIQIGIGGWRPIPAKEVDRLSYGDCKALSNYTKSLLKVAGIQSYYTIIFAGENKKDIDLDFVSMQGNHAILTLPINDKLCFLECTSQTTPFGFGGDFTDDRNALIIKSDKGEIIHTNEYNEKVSSQMTKGNYNLDELGMISGEISIVSKGIQFDNIFTLNKKSPTEISDHYKKRFANINNLKIVNSSFNLNNEKVEFIENLELQAKDYAEINGKKIFFAPNAFNQNQKIPQRYRNRINPLEIQRGFFDSDETEILLPSGFYIEAKPDNFELITKFGQYKTEYIVLSDNKIKYKRNFLLNKGFYDKSEYENYRKFREQVAQNDNSKIVITKN